MPYTETIEPEEVDEQQATLQEYLELVERGVIDPEESQPLTF